MLPTGSFFGSLGRFLGRVLFGSGSPGRGQPDGSKPAAPPKKNELEIRRPGPGDTPPVTSAAQKSYAAEYKRLYGILQNELSGLKTALVPRDLQRRRQTGGGGRGGRGGRGGGRETGGAGILPPETTRHEPRPYGKRDLTQHGYLSLTYGYQDGQDVDVDSSWIGAFNYRTWGGDYGADQDPRDIGDLTMVVLKPSAPNPSGRYTYPSVPRKVMDGAMRAPSKGKFYWSTLRYYSNRGAIGRRLLRTAVHLIANPDSPHAPGGRRRRIR